MKPTVTVRNVVVSADVGRDLGLDYIAERMGGAEYRPNKFRRVVVRLQNPKCAVMVFASGKLVCVGAPSTKLATRAVWTVLGMMRNMGMDVCDSPETPVHNVVATGNLHGRINIEGAAVSLPRAMYEPGMFSGIIHRMLDPPSAVLLFASGKVVCAGARSEGDAHRAINAINSTLTDLGLVRLGAKKAAAVPTAS